MPGRAFATGLLAVGAILVGAVPAGAEITPLAQFGTPGSDAAGEFAGADYIAIDPANGDLYVTDESNDRVSVFNRDGAFVRAFGKNVDPTNAATGPEVCTTTCQSGDGDGSAGSINGPNGIALSDAGELFISEYANDRVSVFTKQGQFLRAFGRGVTGVPGAYGICTVTCSAGDANASTSGAMNTPIGLAIGPDGLLYVADSDNHRINSYSLSGEFVRSLGQGVATGGSTLEACTAVCLPGLLAGNAEGSFNDPQAVAFDADGLLWVAESGGHRVSAITPGPDPTFVRMLGFDVASGGGTGFEVCTAGCKIGIFGGGPGQLGAPLGVAAGADGSLYVAEGANRRVSLFSTTTGAFVKAFGGDVIPGSPFAYEVCTTTCKAGEDDTNPGSLNRPKGMAIDCRGGLYVGEGFGGRVQRFGEPGLPLPPCPQAKPSNDFTITKIKRNRRKGTAKAFVAVPGPGALTLAGRKVKDARAAPATAGTAKLPIKARGKAKRRLHKKGAARVTFAITFTPTGGDPATQSRKVKLKLRRTRR